jgi:hypothetical protein
MTLTDGGVGFLGRTAGGRPGSRPLGRMFVEGPITLDDAA